MKSKTILFLLFCFQLAWGLDVPKLNGRVNDYANVLSTQQRSELNQKLKAFEDSSSTQIVILIMPSLEGENLEEYSGKVATKWKIGQEGKDNGVLVSFFMDDHKDRIEVGYGLEGVLPDAICNRILEDEVKPAFKDEHYFEGISVCIDKIIASTTGEYQKEIATEDHNNLVLIVFAILALVAGIFGYTHWSVSGIVGAIGSPIIWYSMVSTDATALLFAMILGFIGGIIAHGILSISLGGGVTGSDFGDGIIFSSSGDSSSGFSGGGGSFGGGGASGGW